ncbi:MAG: hypothetical protein MZW92_28485 [Comamonadaceae bacterium]|nr:hypothetical protein [Comamonadaceae bacterium]
MSPRGTRTRRAAAPRPDGSTGWRWPSDAQNRPMTTLRARGAARRSAGTDDQGPAGARRRPAVVRTRLARPHAGRRRTAVPGRAAEGVGAGAQRRVDARLLREGRRQPRAARQDDDGAAAVPAPAGRRRLGHHRGHRQPRPHLPPLRRAAGAAGQPAGRRGQRRPGARRAGRRPGVRVLHAGRLDGRAGRTAGGSGGAPDRPAAGGAAGTRRAGRAHRRARPRRGAGAGAGHRRGRAGGRAARHRVLRGRRPRRRRGGGRTGGADAGRRGGRGRRRRARRRLVRAGRGHRHGRRLAVLRPVRAGAGRLRRPAGLTAGEAAAARSGCYLSHDALHYERMQARLRQRAGGLWGSGPGLRNALEVWTVVQSVPEPGRAICAAGKRDLSHDIALPQPLKWWRPGEQPVPQAVPVGLKTVALNDQHAWVDAVDGAAMPWRVGDLVGFGVGHPCTTFDRWSLLWTVDDGYRVTGGVRTFF